MRIKLFVGCAPNGEDAESQMVLEYTARKYTSIPIDIIWMKIDSDPYSHWGGWNTSLWSTPFSGFRWAIPEYCNFKGQAIYMDSDMIIQEDLAKLWNEPWEDRAVLQSKGGWRFCVAKWNCARAEPYLMPIARMKNILESHSRMCNLFPSKPRLIQKFDRQWNNFDGENDDLKDIKILHYTDMSTAPHFKYTMPRLEAADQKHWYDGPIREHRRADVVELFNSYYEEAVLNGMRVADYIPNQIMDYTKLTQKDYTSSNGFDVTKGQ
jgi:hypothetical protein